MYAHWFQAYICVLVNCACILHNWQGLLCITHKSIENSTAFFCTLLFSLSLCWCVFFFFHYRSSALCCSSRRGNGYRDQGCVVWLTKISRSLCMYGLHVCVRVPASVCRCECLCVCVWVSQSSSGGWCCPCCARAGWGTESQLLGVETKWN